jgi:hypothetical protein
MKMKENHNRKTKEWKKMDIRRGEKRNRKERINRERNGDRRYWRLTTEEKEIRKEINRVNSKLIRLDR